MCNNILNRDNNYELELYQNVVLVISNARLSCCCTQPVSCSRIL